MILSLYTFAYASSFHANLLTCTLSSCFKRTQRRTDAMKDLVHRIMNDPLEFIALRTYLAEIEAAEIADFITCFLKFENMCRDFEAPIVRLVPTSRA